MNVNMSLNNMFSIMPKCSSDLRAAGSTQSEKADNNIFAAEQNDSINNKSKIFAAEFDKKTSVKRDSESENSGKAEPKEPKQASDLPKNENTEECQAAQEAPCEDVSSQDVALKAQWQQAIAGNADESGKAVPDLMAEIQSLNQNQIQPKTENLVPVEAKISTIAAESSEKKTVELEIGSGQTDTKLPADLHSELIVNNQAKDELPVDKMVLPDSVGVKAEAVAAGEKSLSQIITSNEKIVDNNNLELPMPEKSSAEDVIGNAALKDVVSAKLPNENQMAAEVDKDKNIDVSSLDLQNAVKQSPKEQPEVASTEPVAADKLDIAQTQALGSETKDSGNSMPGNNSNSNAELFEQMVSSTSFNGQQLTTESSSDVSAKDSSDILPRDLSSVDVGKQIQESIYSSVNKGEDQIVIRLNPSELGSVCIKLQSNQQELTGVLEVSKLETKYEIEKELPQIIQALQSSGVQIKRLELMLTNQEQSLGYKDNPSLSANDSSEQSSVFQQNASDGQNSGFGGKNGNNNLSNQWFKGDDSYYESDYGLQQISEEFVDMLV
ncbi:MAG: flagellar hook-length control protein FliK [Planctomycetes bacterium]|nr:flagellar hook-length control protein FliK [Planctomycetota bacterium]